MRYPTSAMVLWLKSQRSGLGLGLTATRRGGFELYECLLVSLIGVLLQQLSISKYRIIDLHHAVYNVCPPAISLITRGVSARRVGLQHGRLP